MPDKKPAIIVDFDGVIHRYDRPWAGAAVILDGPVPGALAWLKLASEKYEINIFSSRSADPEGIVAIKLWLQRHIALEAGWKDTITQTNGEEMIEIPQELPQPPEWYYALRYPTTKPPAIMTIDDRCMQFNGTFPSLDEIAAFQPWNKRK